MKAPDQEQLDHWASFAETWVPKLLARIEEGRGDQSTYTSLALVYASSGRTKFLQGEPLADVRAEFRQAGLQILKSFTMAYDESDPDYLGDKADLSCNSETIAIDGLNYALIANDFDLGAAMAKWYRDPPAGKSLAKVVNRFTNALAKAMTGEDEQARPLLESQIEAYRKSTPKSPAHKNYHSVVTALWGILTRDPEVFNSGMSDQLAFYEKEARGEIRNTDEGFLCDQAVALANLALHRGMPVSIEHDLMPQALLAMPGKGDQ